MSELIVCRCGHDLLSHPAGKLCMDLECSCALFDRAPSSWAVAYDQTPDDGYQDHLASIRASVEGMAAARMLQVVAENDRLEARTRLLNIAGALAITCVPALTFAICRAVLG